MTLRSPLWAAVLAFLVAMPASAQTRLSAPSLSPAEAALGGDEFPAYTSILSGANVVPPTASSGGGYALADALPDGSFTASAFVRGLASPIVEAHVHQGAAGTEGPVVVSAASIDTFGDQTWIEFAGTLTPEQQTELAAGKLYVDVHTQDVPSGEVRGQLRATDTVQEARAAGVGATVSLFAYVLRAEGAFTYLTDETGSLTVRQTSGAWYDAVQSGQITNGMVVRLTGTLSEFRGLLQINQANATTNDLASFEIGVPVGFNVNAAVEPVTLADIAANGEAYEARLVVVRNVTITGSGPFTAATSYPLDDGSAPASPVVLRVPGASDTAVDGLGIPTGPTTVLAIVGQFTTTTPDVGYQLLVIEPYDVAPTALVQLVHNSPDPALTRLIFTVPTGDVDGSSYEADLQFRTATHLSFLELPAYAGLDLDVRTETGPSIFTATYEDVLVPGGGPLVVVARGVLDPSQFAPNPDGVPTDFGVDTYDPSLQRGAGRVAGLAVQGAPDMPMADLRQGATVLFDDAVYTVGQPFFGVASAATLHLTTADGDSLAEFSVTFEPYDSTAVTVLTSGFLNPAANQNGPGLALLLVDEDGATTINPSVPTASTPAPEVGLTLAVAPNPTAGAAAVTLALPAAGAARVEVFDALGRRVAMLASDERAAGTLHLAVPALAPGVYVVRATTATASVTQMLTVVR